MNIKEAIKARHSVRQFKDMPIGEAEAEKLNAVITAGMSPMAKIDLGIVRYNFEAASGHKCIKKVKLRV